MKSYLAELFKCGVVPAVLASRFSYLQFHQSKKHQFFSSKFLALSVAITLLFSSFYSSLQAQQITEKTIFPLNEYLYTKSNSPYPLVNDSMLNSIDKSKLTNVMDYGAKGDGKTYDDKAIANAIKAAKYGVIFPAGKTFLVSTISKITLTHDMFVYAYGATIKMADQTRYSFLALQYQSGSYHNKVIWLGGTIDGNKNKQFWPGSPTGNNTWAESHGRFIGVSYAQFAMFKDVTLVNTVMDGIGLEANRIAVIANCKASNGARIDYAQTGDQASYFKCTRTGSHAFYCISDTCLDGAIGVHYSTPTKEQALQDSTLSVLTNCYFNNQYSQTVHFEDCWRIYMYKCTLAGDVVEAYKHPAHFSNQTRVAAIKNCTFQNIEVNFNQATNLKIGLIDSCTFTSTTPNLPTFINGNPHLSTHNNFTGSCLAQQAGVKNVRNCTFTNFGSLAIASAYAADTSTFVNGTTPATISKGGGIINCTFKQVKNPTTGTVPSNTDWKKVFSSYIDVYSDANTYLGRINCGYDTTKTQSDTSTTTTTVGSSAAQRHINVAQRTSSDTTVATGLALSDVKISVPTQVTRIYPNPAVDVVHVILNEKITGKTLLNIYDQQGRMVQSKAVEKNTAVQNETLNVSSLTAGAYILQIVNDNQKMALKFVVIR